MFKELEGREILFEFHQIGTIMKVTAMDTLTLTEVIIQAPLHATEQIMKHNALKKMIYVLKKNGKIT